MVFRTIQPSAFLVQADQNLGAVEIGTFTGLILFGVSMMQGFAYFRRYPRDRRLLKGMVYLLLCLETCHSLTAASIIYYDSVTRYLTAMPNSYPLSLNILLETLITFLVQCFFTFRIHVLSNRRSSLSIAATACFSLAFFRFAAGFFLVVEVFLDVPHVPNGLGVVFRFGWLSTSALAGGAAADILIAGSMIYYLRKMASSGNCRSTTTILKRLIRFALQTGLITSMASVAVISCFQTMINMIWFGLYIVLAKLYSNSLLVSLNARPQSDGDSTRTLGSRVSHSGLEFRNTGSKPISLSVNVRATVTSTNHRESDIIDSPRKYASV